MSDHDLLLRAVLAEPEEDGPRLAYADWCEENGQTERAEFIRLQCLIASLESACLCGGCVKRRGGGQHHNGPCAVDRHRTELPDGSSRQAFLRRREWELLGPWWETWCEPPPKDSNGYVFSQFCDNLWRPRPTPTPWVRFNRGFVHAVALSAAGAEARLDAILAAQPVREVVLTTWPEPQIFAGLWLNADGVWSSARWPGVAFRLPEFNFEDFGFREVHAGAADEAGL